VDLAISGISVHDLDNARLTVTLRVGQGTLTLGASADVVIRGNRSGRVTLSGSLAGLNAALATLVYRGNRNFSGADLLRVIANDGSRITTNSVAITVLSTAQQAANLQARIHALYLSGVLNRGQANALTFKLNLKGNDGDIGRVQSFRSQVRRLRNDGILTPAQANVLLELASILLTSLQRR